MRIHWGLTTGLIGNTLINPLIQDLLTSDVKCYLSMIGVHAVSIYYL